MSFDNNYENRKDRRQPLYGDKALSHKCRNHGACETCQHDRTFDNTKNKVIAKNDIKYLDKDLVDLVDLESTNVV